MRAHSRTHARTNAHTLDLLFINATHVQHIPLPGARLLASTTVLAENDDKNDDDESPHHPDQQDGEGDEGGGTVVIASCGILHTTHPQQLVITAGESGQIAQ